MPIIEALLKQSKKHAEVVILVLLGLLIIGSICGGLYIQYLSSIVTEMEKLERQRLGLAEERYRNSMAISELRFSKLLLDVDRLALSSGYFSKEMDDAANELKQIALSEKLSSETKTKLLDLSSNLPKETAKLSNEIMTIIASFEGGGGDEVAASMHDARAYEGNFLISKLPLMIMVLILIAMLVIAALLWKGNRQRITKV